MIFRNLAIIKRKLLIFFKLTEAGAGKITEEGQLKDRE